MGTRAVIDIEDEDGKVLVTIYRQFDGYPLGLGADIKKILGNPRIVNGFSLLKDKTPEAFNGMGCLAAYLIGQLKTEIGNVYIRHHSDNPKEDCWAEFFYKLMPSANMQLLIQVFDLTKNELIYNGPLAAWEIPFEDK